MEEIIKPKKEKYIYIFIGVILIFAIIALIIVKMNIPTFKIGFLLLSIGGIILLFVGIGFIAHFLLKKKKEPTEEEQNKMPKAIDTLQAIEIAKTLVSDNKEFLDYLENTGGYTVEKLGRTVKSSVFTYFAKGLYEDNNYVIIMNMHYPQQTNSVLINPSKNDILIGKMRAADFPEVEPQTRVVSTRNAITGVEQNIIEPVTKEKAEETKKKEEDL